MEMESMPAARTTRRSHSDLIVLGGVSLWCFTLGIGFPVLWAVKRRMRQLSPLAASAEREQLKKALVLAQASVLLFCVSLLGIVLMVWGHGQKWQKTHRNVNVTQAAAQARESIGTS